MLLTLSVPQSSQVVDHSILIALKFADPPS